MIAPRHDEDGFTLVELLIAMTLSLIIVTATLAVFAQMERGTRDNQQLNEAQTQVRVATDGLARRLRNLASPDYRVGATAGTQQPLERATAQDLVFRTVSPEGAATPENLQNVERNRYCLRAGDGALLMQRQTGDQVVTTAPPSDGACPGAGWDTPAGAGQNYRVVAQNITNGSRPMFVYEVSPTPGSYAETATVDDPELYSAIGLRMQLFVDPDTLHGPRETTVTSRVFLRNQNRKPLPAFDVTTSGMTLLLNASASADPENKPLKYEWLDNGSPLLNAAGAEVGKLDTAVTSVEAKPGTTYHLTLRVTDIGGLHDVTTSPVTVTCSTATETTPAQCATF